VKEVIWDSMLDADMNGRYYGELGSRNYRWDRAAKIFLAATSSTSVAGWAFWANPEMAWTWQTLSGISAVCALALPIIDPAKLATKATKLSTEWFSIMSRYELLWSQRKKLSDTEMETRVQALKAEEKNLGELASVFRWRRKLIRECQKAVCRARGLSTQVQDGGQHVGREPEEAGSSETNSAQGGPMATASERGNLK
jgi:hypothetical protein